MALTTPSSGVEYKAGDLLTLQDGNGECYSNDVPTAQEEALGDSPNRTIFLPDCIGSSWHKSEGGSVRLFLFQGF